MEHIEEAGIHSGDSMCVWPPVTLSKKQASEIEFVSLKIARGLGVVGLLNIQFAIRGGRLYVLEANPRSSRTVPFISKARGIPWARIGAKACLGVSLADALAPHRAQLRRPPRHFAVKAPVFSWGRFPGADALLGPEMKSTGEAMAVGRTFGEAFLKTHAAVARKIPEKKSGILFSLKDQDKARFVGLARRFQEAGFALLATKNTARYFRDHGSLDVREVFKIGEGRPNVTYVIANGEAALVVNTPSGASRARADGYAIRSSALLHNIAIVPTPRALQMILEAVLQTPQRSPQVYALQDLN
jgi:carbamoyl-phosphate synthase large subunit